METTKQEPPKRGRGRPKGSTKGPGEPAKRLAEAKAKKAAKRSAKRGPKPRAEKRPAAQQLVVAELVETGQGFGEAEYKRKREEEARQREEAKQGGADGQFQIPYPFTAGRKKLLEFNEYTLTRIWQAGTCRCTLAETAATLGVSEKTLSRFFQEHPDARDVYDDASLLANASMRSHLNREALSGNTSVLLHCAKHWLGMTDKRSEDDPATALEEKLTQVADRLRSKYLAAMDEGGAVEVHPDPV
jgi:hypothetical protein